MLDRRAGAAPPAVVVGGLRGIGDDGLGRPYGQVGERAPVLGPGPPDHAGGRLGRERRQLVQDAGRYRTPGPVRPAVGVPVGDRPVER